MTGSKLYTMAEQSDTGSSSGSSGVVLSKKPRQPREVRILSTSYNPSGAADATAEAAPPTHKYEIGVDEAGRGPLFGRVYTGAVILPHPASSAAASSFDFSLLKDSKKFTSEKKIREVSDYIKQHAVAWAVAYEEPAVIDALNIRRATLQCMRTAINTVIKNHGSSVSPSPPTSTTDYLLLIDGNDFIPMGNFNQRTSEIENYRHVCVESGDNTYACIAAGSILAKVARDDYIEKLCDEYPVLDELYSLRGNKGYGAKKHMDGIREHGITQWHRRSYGICRSFE